METLEELLQNGVDIAIEDGWSYVISNGERRILDVFLKGSESHTVPKGTIEVRDISLHDSSSLIFLEGLKKMGYIRLQDKSSLALPEGLTQIDSIELSDNKHPLILPSSVNKIKWIRLKNSHPLVLPNGVTQIDTMFVLDFSTVILPQSFRQGDPNGVIYLRTCGAIKFSDGFILDGPARINAHDINKLLIEHQKSPKEAKREALKEKAANFFNRQIEKLGSQKAGEKLGNQLKR